MNKEGPHLNVFCCEGNVDFDIFFSLKKIVAAHPTPPLPPAAHFCVLINDGNPGEAGERSDFPARS